ncbi:MAG: hypothetical protein ABSA97_02380 [Verrucomicrobiia bacterium]
MSSRIGMRRIALGIVVALGLRHRSAVSRWAQLAVVVASFAAAVSVVQGQSFTDPGFENYEVSSGGFVKPVSGPWMFSNDAGVVEPYASNSSTGALYTWSAMFSAPEGQQYASTYAAIDTIRQAVSFDTAGDYVISVYAAAPAGSVTIPTVGTLTLEDGEFTFTVGNTAIGSLHTVPTGSGWDSYSAVFSIGDPGSYTLGVRNTKTASYFINYDAFAIQPVPEPTTFQLVLAFGAVAAGVKAARGWRR